MNEELIKFYNVLRQGYPDVVGDMSPDEFVQSVSDRGKFISFLDIMPQAVPDFYKDLDKQEILDRVYPIRPKKQAAPVLGPVTTPQDPFNLIPTLEDVEAAEESSVFEKLGNQADTKAKDVTDKIQAERQAQQQQGFVVGAPNLNLPDNVSTEDKNKIRAELRINEAIENGLLPDQFTPKEWFQYVNPDDSADAYENINTLERSFNRGLDEDGKIDPFAVTRNVMPEYLKVIRPSVKMTPEEILAAKEIDGLSKEGLAAAKQYVSEHQLARAKQERKELELYSQYLQKTQETHIPPRVIEAYEVVGDLAPKYESGEISEEEAESLQQATDYLQSLPEETKLHLQSLPKGYERLQTQLSEIDTKYPELPIVEKLNQEIQRSYDEWYSQLGQGIGNTFAATPLRYYPTALKSLLNVAKAGAEVYPTLTESLASTYDAVAGGLFGDQDAKANTIRRANAFVQPGTLIDATEQKRGLNERVADVNFEGNKYEVGFDNDGRVSGIYDQFGSRVNLTEEKLSQIGQFVDDQGLYGESRKVFNNSAAFNAVSDGVRDLAVTMILSKGLGTAVGGASGLAQRVREGVPIMFQYTGRMAEEGINQGLTPDEALVYAGLQAGMESGTEMMFPFVGALTGSGFNAKRALRSILANPEQLKSIGRREFFDIAVKGLLGEGVEEGTAAILNPVINQVANSITDENLDTTVADWEQISTAAALGLTIGALPGLVGGIARSRQVGSDSYLAESIYSATLSDNIQQSVATARSFNKPEYDRIADILQITHDETKDIREAEATERDKVRAIVDKFNAVKKRYDSLEASGTASADKLKKESDDLEQTYNKTAASILSPTDEESEGVSEESAEGIQTEDIEKLPNIPEAESEVSDGVSEGVNINETAENVEDIPQTDAVSEPVSDAVTGQKFTATLYHGVGTGEPSDALYLGDRGLAEDYADDKEVKQFEVTLDNPYVVRTDEDFELVDSFIQEFRKDNPEAPWHPETTTYVNNKLRELGHDGLVITEESLKTEKGFDRIEGTYGNAQVVVLDKAKAVDVSNQSSQIEVDETATEGIETINRQETESAAEIKGTKKVAEHFNKLVNKLPRVDVNQLLGDWAEAELTPDGTGIVIEDSFRREAVGGRGAKVKPTKREFLEWLNSDAPFDEVVYGVGIRQDTEYTDRIKRAREAAGLSLPITAQQETIYGSKTPQIEPQTEINEPQRVVTPVRKGELVKGDIVEFDGNDWTVEEVKRNGFKLKRNTGIGKQLAFADPVSLEEITGKVANQDINQDTFVQTNTVPNIVEKPTEKQRTTLASLTKTLQDVFKLPKAKADAVARVADRIVGTIASRTGKSKQEIYDTISFEIPSQAVYDDLLRQARGNNNDPTQEVNGEVRGALVTQDAQFIIYALTNPNVSTPLHELAHVFERYLTPEERDQIISAAGTNVLVGNKLIPGWTTDTSEYFAKGFEQYLRTGLSPVPELKPLFDKFREWLVDIYRSVRDLNVTPTREVIDIYRRMLGAEDSNLLTEEEKIIEDKVDDFLAQFQIVGEQGAINLDSGDAVNRINSLDVARKMESEGEGVVAIRLSTGWERGADGLWRYEVPDVMSADRAKLTFSLTKTTVHDRLGDVIDAPILFKAYPQLKDLRLIVFPDNDNPQRIEGQYDHEDESISLLSSVVDTPQGYTTLLHELQHAIQHIEGFDTGSNIDRGAVMAISAQKGITPKQYIDRVRELQQAIEDAKVDKLPQEYTFEKSPYLDDKQLPWMVKHPTFVGVVAWGRTKKDAQARALQVENSKRTRALQKELTDFATTTESEARKYYMAKVGEVEARNVETRVGFTDEQRRLMPLVNTEDVAREDQVFLERNLGDGLQGDNGSNEGRDSSIQLGEEGTRPDGRRLFEGDRESPNQPEGYTGLDRPLRQEEGVVQDSQLMGVPEQGIDTRGEGAGVYTDSRVGEETQRGEAQFQVQPIQETPFTTRDGKPIGFNYDTDQVARERFDIPRLERIGEGSDRVVFDLGDGKVLKVAKTPRGLDQNIYEGDRYLAGIVPDSFERGLNYVVVQNTPRAKNQDVIPIFNSEGEEVGTSTVGQMIKDLKTITQAEFNKHTSDVQDILYKYGFEDILNYDVIWNDFAAIRNWGYLDGRAVHLDGGTFGGTEMLTSRPTGMAVYDPKYRKMVRFSPLSDEEFRDIYYRSRAAKKAFGDTDKFTKFQAVPTQKGPTKKEVLQRLNEQRANFEGISGQALFDRRPQFFTDLKIKPSDLQKALEGRVDQNPRRWTNVPQEVIDAIKATGIKLKKVSEGHIRRIFSDPTLSIDSKIRFVNQENFEKQSLTKAEIALFARKYVPLVTGTPQEKLNFYREVADDLVKDYSVLTKGAWPVWGEQAKDYLVEQFDALGDVEYVNKVEALAGQAASQAASVLGSRAAQMKTGKDLIGQRLVELRREQFAKLDVPQKKKDGTTAVPREELVPAVAEVSVTETEAQKLWNKIKDTKFGKELLGRMVKGPIKITKASRPKQQKGIDSLNRANSLIAKALTAGRPNVQFQAPPVNPWEEGLKELAKAALYFANGDARVARDYFTVQLKDTGIGDETYTDNLFDTIYRSPKFKQALAEVRKDLALEKAKQKQESLLTKVRLDPIDAFIQELMWAADSYGQARLRLSEEADLSRYDEKGKNALNLFTSQAEEVVDKLRKGEFTLNQANTELHKLTEGLQESIDELNLPIHTPRFEIDANRTAADGDKIRIGKDTYKFKQAEDPTDPGAWVNTKTGRVAMGERRNQVENEFRKRSITQTSKRVDLETLSRNQVEDAYLNFRQRFAFEGKKLQDKLNPVEEFIHNIYGIDLTGRVKDRVFNQEYGKLFEPEVAVEIHQAMEDKTDNRPLADKISSITGLPIEESTRLANAWQDVFDQELAEDKRRILEKYSKSNKTIEKALDVVRSGTGDVNDLMMAFGADYGFDAISAREAEKFRQLTENYRNAVYEADKTKALNEISNFLLQHKGESWATKAFDFYVEMQYGAMLNGITTLWAPLLGNTALAADILIDTFGLLSSSVFHRNTAGLQTLWKAWSYGLNGLIFKGIPEMSKIFITGESSVTPFDRDVRLEAGGLWYKIAVQQYKDLKIKDRTYPARVVAAILSLPLTLVHRTFKSVVYFDALMKGFTTPYSQVVKFYFDQLEGGKNFTDFGVRLTRALGKSDDIDAIIEQEVRDRGLGKAKAALYRKLRQPELWNEFAEENLLARSDASAREYAFMGEHVPGVIGYITNTVTKLTTPQNFKTTEAKVLSGAGVLAKIQFAPFIQMMGRFANTAISFTPYNTAKAVFSATAQGASKLPIPPSAQKWFKSAAEKIDPFTFSTGSLVGFSPRPYDGLERTEKDARDRYRTILRSLAGTLAMYGIYSMLYFYDIEEDESGKKKRIIKLKNFKEDGSVIITGPGLSSYTETVTALPGWEPNAVLRWDKDKYTKIISYDRHPIGVILAPFGWITDKALLHHVNKNQYADSNLKYWGAFTWQVAKSQSLLVLSGVTESLANVNDNVSTLLEIATSKEASEREKTKTAQAIKYLWDEQQKRHALMLTGGNLTQQITAINRSMDELPQLRGENAWQDALANTFWFDQNYQDIKINQFGSPVHKKAPVFADFDHLSAYLVPHNSPERTELEREVLSRPELHYPGFYLSGSYSDVVQDIPEDYIRDAKDAAGKRVNDLFVWNREKVYDDIDLQGQAKVEQQAKAIQSLRNMATENSKVEMVLQRYYDITGKQLPREEFESKSSKYKDGSGKPLISLSWDKLKSYMKDNDIFISGDKIIRQEFYHK